MTTTYSSTVFSTSTPIVAPSTDVRSVQIAQLSGPAVVLSNGTTLAPSATTIFSLATATAVTGTTNGAGAAVVAVTEDIAWDDNAFDLRTFNAQSGTTYTLALTDVGKVIRCSNAAAVTVTVPPTSSVAIPVGSQIDIVQGDVGSVTIAAGAGVTLNTPPNRTLLLNGQYAYGVLTKIASDTWNFAGNSVDATGLWSELLTTGETPRPRTSYTGAATGLTSQTLYLTYFRCRRTELVNSIVFGTATTGAADDPTVVRYGLWTATENGALTALVASTPNDAPTTMLASTQTRYPKAVTETYTKQCGQFYAVGVLVVSATTMPNMYTIPIAGNNTLGTIIAGSTGVTLPRVFANVASQSDLPPSVAVGSLSGQPWGPYCEVI